MENVVSNMRHTSCESAWVFVLFVVSPQVFCELGRALEYELDFLHEAQAAEKIWAAVSHTIGGEPAAPSLVVPRPIPNLASRRRVRPSLPRKLPASVARGLRARALGGVAWCAAIRPLLTTNTFFFA